LLVVACVAPRALAVGGTPCVETHASQGAFPLFNGSAAPVLVASNDWAGVIRATEDLRLDIQRVTGDKPAAAATPGTGGRHVVVIGTVGRSEWIDQLVREKKIDVSDIDGKWEATLIQVVSNALPGVDSALVIAGSDKRGTIYGVYELSEQIGVSPWYWWADVPAKQHDALFVKPGRQVQGPPAVKYRGIFINDEEPALGRWAREKFGGVNSRMYVHVFELLLRLRGNFLWPAMWGKSIYEDDPESARMADEYGIVLGTSHHEPMTRAQQDWTRNSQNYGTGEWDYSTNAEGLKKFWAEGITRNRDYEVLITLGMRGDGDEPMTETESVSLLERIVADQRRLIGEIINPDVAQVPQVWALYKEVQGYYERGMRVPDDVTLLWCDDNWGNLRRLPTPKERMRSGSAGIYYHLDYVGSPRSYKWINVSPLPKIWEQMNMAYEYGANQIWVVNVGDLKPMEIPIEFFLRMAWNPRALPKESIAEFTRRWAEREFGPEHAGAIADIVSKYAKYNAWRKPELLEPDTFSLANYQEAERVLAAWQEIAAHAERINSQLPPESRDAFYELVLYPAKASATVAGLYIAVGRNHLYAAQGRASANDQAQHARELFQLDSELSAAYHQLAGGKWNHMMSQTHIGYSSWRDPETNIMPQVVEVALEDAPSLGVAIEGSTNAWPGESKPAVLPPFDSLNQQQRWMDVFKRGRQGFAFKATASEPWVRLSPASGMVDQDQRLWVSMDWDQIPAGTQVAEIKVSRVDGESVTIQVNAIRSDTFTRANVAAFGGLTGPTAFAAESAAKNIPADGVRWEKIPDYGRGASGMAVFPVTAQSVMPPENSPRLEYPVFIAEAGPVQVGLITGISLDVQPDRGVRIAVSFDDQAPQILDAFAGQSYADPSKRGDPSAPPIRSWSDWVRDNARTLKSTHHLSTPGVHTLKVWMVDPGTVLEKIVIDKGDPPDSYFGPPESPGCARP
ncbi:MAG: glycosyl hydrolase 115 family protein, partial [Verrucomicrobia bacterium]|nr:glycosyl hydrolase 115 family protein [Verrucomicrobiota bacterium]